MSGCYYLNLYPTHKTNRVHIRIPISQPVNNYWDETNCIDQLHVTSNWNVSVYCEIVMH